MNTRNIIFTIAIIFALGGIYQFWLAGTYAHGYLTDTASTERHKYMQGMLLALLLAVPFWVLVSALLFPIRNKISRSIYISLNTPTVIFCAGFVLANIYAVIMVLIFNVT